MNSVKGFNGTLSFDGETVTIERKGAGRTRLPLSAIKSVEYKKGGLLVGYVKFHTGADIDNRKTRNKAEALMRDPHAVTHQWTSNKAMGELVDQIEAALYAKKPVD
ncbi:hypothetical protein HYQ03_gp25 [Arthrobacter phage Kuleana]|uniref:DUF4429 domain-containing protein n=1 Tax=Arthrobacter phage Kuleana TaxID=2653270 RepID=A0A5Q2W8J9_9CAUD|nr:hypothetical protein HYQ03_gp25 [Arthrobacter phage Kuleana]QGH74512.1 hypothetical protein SEA_KULEANA_25 [Arthrobacter phage Kuleana]